MLNLIRCGIVAFPDFLRKPPRKPTRFEARLRRNRAASKRKQRARPSDSDISLGNASTVNAPRKKTGKKQKMASMKENKKTVRKSVRKTTKKPVKPLANVSKKATARRVDLAKAHVKAKRAGKVVSNETFSSTTKESVDALLSATIELKDDDLDSAMSVSSSSPNEHVWLVKPNKRLTSPWWKHYLVYNAAKHPNMTKVAYCNIGGDKNGIGGCGCKIQIQHGTGGLKRHIAHKHYNAYVAIRRSGSPSSTTPNKRPFNRDDWVTPSVAGRHFQIEDTIPERKKKYLARALYYTIHRSIPHATFEDPAF